MDYRLCSGLRAVYVNPFDGGNSQRLVNSQRGQVHSGIVVPEQPQWKIKFFAAQWSSNCLRLDPVSLEFADPIGRIKIFLQPLVKLVTAGFEILSGDGSQRDDNFLMQVQRPTEGQLVDAPNP
jgi:hypothetical protein